ncbi:MAG: 6-carboxytetrahydropterin synthase [Ignavibacteriales bacterium]|nr:6-carboxytetrahydropterin synthase [Ignavibacteriales bacterium]
MAKRIFVTRREVFSSAHRLYNPAFTDDENELVYDKCNNYHGHGHNYVLEVVVEGEIDERTGYVIDLKVLKKIIIENVIRKVDHKHLNLDVDFMKDVIPTAENIAVKIWEQLVDKIPNGRLYKIRLSETENNYVEYFGE